MELKAEVIQSNWGEFLNNIKTHISGERGKKLITFYQSLEDRIILMPASIKKEYHGAFPGGYIAHVNNVVKNSIALYEVWKTAGANMETFSFEELIFSAINHDLGKIGDMVVDAYIEQTDSWRKDKLGEMYTFNTELAFASVPDRSLYLLQANGIPYSFNEMLAIQTHDGLYDEGNKKYLMGHSAELKPRTSLVYILHQADIMAARIEFEVEWKGKFTKEEKENLDKVKKNNKLGVSQPSKDKALSSIKSNKLKNFLSSIEE